MDPDIIQGFVKAIELKDRSTAAHTWRVVLYARALALQGVMAETTDATATTLRGLAAAHAFVTETVT